MKIDPPAVDAGAGRRPADRGDCRRLLLGHPGGVPAHQGRHQRRLRLCRRRQEGRRTTNCVSTGRTGHAEAVQITYDPRVDLLRQAPADLLLGGARPDRSSTARARTPARNTAPRFSRRPTSRRRSPRPTSRSSTRAKVFPQADRDQDRHHEGRVLSGRGLSPGLRHPASEQSRTSSFNDAPKVENLKRHVPGCVPRQAGAGGGGGQVGKSGH